MDNYVEHILEKKVATSQMLAMAGAIMLTVSGVVTMLFIKFGIGILLIAVGAFLIFVAKEGFAVEYEYEFTNGDCEVAKITNKSSRKEKYKFSAGDVTRVLLYNSEKFQNELSVNAKLKIVNLTSGYNENQDYWYAFMLSVNDEDVAVIMELNDRCVDHVKTAYRLKAEF